MVRAGRHVVMLFILAAMAAWTPTSAAAQEKVKKSRAIGAAGVVSVRSPQVTTTAISGAFANGFYCVSGQMAKTHELGWVPRDIAITVEFWSDSTSDPIAVLSSIQFEGNAGGERFNSDDEGGQLNPYFRMMKPYSANWVLTVGSADGTEACYSYKVTLQ